MAVTKFEFVEAESPGAAREIAIFRQAGSQRWKVIRTRKTRQPVKHLWRENLSVYKVTLQEVR